MLVTKLDRFTRSLRDLYNINEDLLEPFCCNLVAIRDGINTFETMGKMLSVPRGPWADRATEYRRARSSDDPAFASKAGTTGRCRLVSRR